MRYFNWILWVSSIYVLSSCNKPLASFVLSEEPKAAKSVEFENKSEKADRYEWDFGDGSTSEEANPAHIYMSSGNYDVKLKAYSGDKKVNEKILRLQVAAPELCLVQIETPFGSMLVQLYDATPIHQDNFVKLAERGFYDSLLFHRVIRNFMVQGGDPNSKGANKGMPLGMGGPGYTIPAEFVDSLVHVRGAIAAARLGDRHNPKKNSSGSQFYIVQGRPVTDADLDKYEAMRGVRYSTAQREAYKEYGGAPQLDGAYTVFGRVIEGMEVIDNIAKAKTDPHDRPLEDIWMIVRVVK